MADFYFPNPLQPATIPGYVYEQSLVESLNAEFMHL